MDHWEALLDRTVATRMDAIQAEMHEKKPPAPQPEEVPVQPELPSAPQSEEEDSLTSEPVPEKPQQRAETPEEPDEEPEPIRIPLRQTDGTKRPLEPGEMRTITLSLYDEEPEPPAPTGSQGGKRALASPRRREKPPKTGESPEEDPPAQRRQNRMVSLKARWLWNSMGTVCLFMVLVGALSVILLSSYFYSTMESGLESRAQTAAGFFANYQTESEYLEQAERYTANFDESDAIELEFINTSGEIICSSYAYQQTSGVTPDTRDILQALESGTLTTWIGKDPFTGERIMAVSAPVVQNGTVKGVIRMVTSTRAVDRQLLAISLLLFVLLLAVLLLIYSTNLYFVKSIAQPIAAITETTKRIAAGSYGIQIEKEYNDEIGELVDTINDMSMKISQAEKVKSEFISSVSHELRTPLTAINGWGETLVRGDITDPRDLQKGLAIIVSEARRLTKMVEELLEFSRIEDGRFTLRIEQIDIKAELEDAVYTYREFFRKKGIALEYQDCEEEFPPIPGDPERLRQVFSNLLDNAAKHGGSGKRILVSIHPRGRFVAIQIRDYGHGIPQAELPHVKTKFYKGSSKARGSGIGLAVCDEIARRHNGTLDIANALGGGCVVTLCLPVQ